MYNFAYCLKAIHIRTTVQLELIVVFGPCNSISVILILQLTSQSLGVQKQVLMGHRFISKTDDLSIEKEWRPPI